MADTSGKYTPISREESSATPPEKATSSSASTPAEKQPMTTDQFTYKAYESLREAYTMLGYLPTEAGRPRLRETVSPEVTALFEAITKPGTEGNPSSFGIFGKRAKEFDAFTDSVREKQLKLENSTAFRNALRGWPGGTGEKKKGLADVIATQKRNFGRELSNLKDLQASMLSEMEQQFVNSDGNLKSFNDNDGNPIPDVDGKLFAQAMWEKTEKVLQAKFDEQQEMLVELHEYRRETFKKHYNQAQGYYPAMVAQNRLGFATGEKVPLSLAKKTNRVEDFGNQALNDMKLQQGTIHFLMRGRGLDEVGYIEEYARSKGADGLPIIKQIGSLERFLFGITQLPGQLKSKRYAEGVLSETKGPNGQIQQTITIYFPHNASTKDKELALFDAIAQMSVRGNTQFDMSGIYKFGLLPTSSFFGFTDSQEKSAMNIINRVLTEVNPNATFTNYPPQLKQEIMEAKMKANAKHGAFMARHGFTNPRPFPDDADYSFSTGKKAPSASTSSTSVTPGAPSSSSVNAKPAGAPPADPALSVRAIKNSKEGLSSASDPFENLDSNIFSDSKEELKLSSDLKEELELSSDSKEELELSSDSKEELELSSDSEEKLELFSDSEEDSAPDSDSDKAVKITRRPGSGI